MADDPPDFENLQNGDGDAWDRVFHLYWSLIKSVARQQGGRVLTETDLEDIGQDVFLKLVKELKKPYKKFNLKPWLLWATRCRTIEVVRKKLGGPDLKSFEQMIEESGDQFASPGSSWLNDAEVHDQAKELREMFPGLDELTALLLVEKFCNQMKNPDLAEKYHLTPGAVATRISRGLSEMGGHSGDD